MSFIKKWSRYIVEIGICEFFVVFIFWMGYSSIEDTRDKFKGVDCFYPVYAVMQDYVKESYYDGMDKFQGYRYDIVYLYKVDGVVYNANFYNEEILEKIKKIYYHPNNHEIYSSYATYEEAHQSIKGFITGAYIFQGAIIVYISYLMYLYRKQKKTIIKTEVISYDDLDEFMNKDVKAEEQGIQREGREKSIAKNLQRLYTEEEYKKLKLNL